MNINPLVSWIKEAIPYFKRRRFCPVCGKYSKEFREYGVVPRKDAMCPYCGALERHRFAWLFFNQRTDLFNGKPKRMLHVAPEPCFEPIFKRRIRDGYITADLFSSLAMAKMDIMDIQYPDEYFDVIYCSHVLEHVPDDRKAMREFLRVLSPGGWAVLMVPIRNIKVTFEDPSITTPEDRTRIFGQSDHVRNYGRDFPDRLREAGFKVSALQVSDLCNEEEISLMALTRVGNIFFCMKN